MNIASLQTRDEDVSTGPVSGQSARARLDHFLNHQAALLPDGLGARLTTALLDTITHVPPEHPAKRRPSMYPDGTKITLSHKLNRDADPSVTAEPVRLLVEPGGTGFGLPEQIDFSLSQADHLLGILSCRPCADIISHMARMVFPTDPAALNDWWGGIWLGGEVTQTSANLRIYFDLRSGPVAQRWQRVADAIAPLAKSDYEPVFLSLADHLSEQGARPAGIAIQISKGRVDGLRLYAALPDPTPEVAARASPLADVDAGDIARTITDYCSHFGALPTTGLTLAVDLPCGSDSTLRGPARYKVDLGCATVDETRRPALDRWVGTHLTAAGAASFTDYRAALDRSFGGSVLQYLSFGYRLGGSRELTSYFIPNACARTD